MNENDRKVVKTVQPVSNFYHTLICAAIRSAKTSLSTREEESRARTQLRRRELESSDHMLSATQPDFALVFESLCLKQSDCFLQTPEERGEGKLSLALTSTSNVTSVITSRSFQA